MEQELWREQSRVEEVDSESDEDTQGVGLNFDRKRFSSDALLLTGGDLGPASRVRRSYIYQSEEEDSEEDLDELDEEGSVLQIALRDKEEALVQSALARIRRAQAKGKREVRLNQEELDALEKRRKRMQLAATSKAKNGSGSGGGSERKRRSEQNLISVPIEPRSRKSIQPRRSEEHVSHSAAPPGMLISGPNGVTYAPLGYYSSQSGSNRNSPTRPRSATTSHSRSGTPPQFMYQQNQPRQFSEQRPTSSSSTSSRRPLPDEEDWVPRRSSISSQSYPIDPFEYQVSSDHIPSLSPQYTHPSSRRIVSGPPEISYSSIRRSPPQAGYPSSSRAPASDPVPRTRSFRRDSSSEDDDASDDQGNGVQVFVEEEADRERERERERERVTRKPVGGKKKGKGR
jgi:hypothetical protein